MARHKSDIGVKRVNQTAKHPSNVAHRHTLIFSKLESSSNGQKYNWKFVLDISRKVSGPVSMEINFF